MDVVGSGGPLADRVFSQAEHGVQVLGESVADSGIESAKNAKKAQKKKYLKYTEEILPGY